MKKLHISSSKSKLPLYPKLLIQLIDRAPSASTTIAFSQNSATEDDELLQEKQARSKLTAIY
jgi:hypothetical protein